MYNKFSSLTGISFIEPSTLQLENLAMEKIRDKEVTTFSRHVEVYRVSRSSTRVLKTLSRTVPHYPCVRCTKSVPHSKVLYD